MEAPGGALVVGFAYLVAAYLVQGAFKETMQALFVLAFAIGLAALAAARPGPPGDGAAAARGRAAGRAGGRQRLRLQLPGAALARGSFAVWAASSSAGDARGARRTAARRSPGGDRALVAIGSLALAIAPELGPDGRLRELRDLQPAGPGLGNLFNRLSPLEALGIWPSGDFRVDPEVARGPDSERLERREAVEQVAEPGSVRIEGLEARELSHPAELGGDREREDREGDEGARRRRSSRPHLSASSPRRVARPSSIAAQTASAPASQASPGKL